VTGQWLDRPISGQERAAQIDVRQPHPARVYDYWLGGKDNFAADRETAREAIAANPQITEDARANRAFLARSVHHLAARRGIRQFLDIGSGLPSAANTHEVAQAAAADARVLYVDNDPVVLNHSRAMLVSGKAGRCGYLDADLRDPLAILAGAARTLDFSRPVALMLLMVLHLIPDTDSPEEIVATLLQPLAAGSYLVLSHPAGDVRAEEIGEMTRRINQRMSRSQVTLRDRAQITRFFRGLDLVPPGVVQPPRWRPDKTGSGPGAVTAWCGAGRKP
jgi:S-adenosyl methyltransferase